MNENEKISGYHPELPFAENFKGEGIKNYQKVVKSDHVFILATIPLDENKNIKIVSGNVLESGGANGFFQNGEYKVEGEPTEVQKERHTNIAESLKKIIDNNDIDFITLQEIKGDEPKNQDRLYFKIAKSLGENWACVKTSNDEIVDLNGCITFYNKKYFPVLSENSTFTDFKTKKIILAGNIVKFKIGFNKKINLLNTHADFRVAPKEHEDEIQDFLKEVRSTPQEHNNDISIVIGDFNCSIAPSDNRLKNITTSVSSGKFDEINEGEQGAWAVDGCFYSDTSEEKNKAVVYIQAKIQHLNSNTGEVYEGQEIPPLDDSNLTEHQKLEIDSLRLIVCVDDDYKYHNLINGETIFQYEKSLKENLGNKNILVRRAKNLKNEDGIGILVDQNIFNFLENHKDYKYIFQFNKKAKIGHEDNPCYMICAKKENVKNLVKAMTTACFGLHAIKLGALASELINFANALNEGKENSETNETIKKHMIDFVNEAIKLKDKISIQTILEFKNKLDIDLYGKKPMSSKVAGALSGFITAAIVFCMVTVAVSGGLSGFVAIGIPMIAGLITALTSGAAIGTFGFFSLKIKNEKHVNKREELTNKNGVVIDSAEAIYSKLIDLKSGNK